MKYGSAYFLVPAADTDRLTGGYEVVKIGALSRLGGPSLSICRPVLAGAGAAVMVTLLAACGGAESASAKGTKPADPDEQRLRFTRCMREHGVDVPDENPANPGKGTTLKGDGAKIDEAFKACQKQVPSGVNQNDPKVKDELLRLVRCMREHGVDMPDPGPDGGIKVKDTGNGADKEKFDKALKACNKPAKVGGSGQSDGGAG